MGSGNVFDFLKSAANSEMSHSVEISLKIRKYGKIGLNTLMLREKKPKQPRN